jgi:hypothetical protein
MKLRIKSIQFIIFLVFCIIVPTQSISSLPNKSSKDQLLIDNGWLERYDGIPVLHLKGSWYEMGYQHGSLLADEISEDIRAYLNFAENHGTSYEELFALWNITKEFTPAEIIKEMQGMADGSGISFTLIAITNIIPMRYHCCGIAAWGTSTTDGRLYHIRSLDYALDIIDPESGTYLQENQIMIVREPEDGYASLYPGFAGFAGCLGGINDQGIAVGQASSWCDDETDYGTPMTFRLKYALEHAQTADEAAAIITNNSTCGYNYIISDAKQPLGYAVETTATLSYIGTWDNPSEETDPCWEIQDVVRRTNFFINPETAKTQRENYDPSSIIRFILGKNPDYPFWRHYQTLSRGIESIWGLIDLNTTMTMLRQVYTGQTDPLVFLAQFFGFLRTMHQWVACPETGEMVISFASPTKSAFKNQVYFFNLNELLV